MRQEIVEYTDDLDGEPIEVGLAQTIRFTVDGGDYEIDLRPVHAERFRTESTRWIAAAAAQGIAVSSRGRVPQQVLAQFDAAHAR